MSIDALALVPLGALSDRQRRLAESHLPLVYLTLNRLTELVERHRRRGPYMELVQEGSLALVEAIRSHDVARHGAFGPYAMARIHFAVSRFVHETAAVIRVPYISQRRGRKRRFMKEKERHSPFCPPRVVPLSARHQISARREEHVARRGRTVGEIVRERYERAADRVAEGIRGPEAAQPAERRILERCLSDRISIPEPDEKTSLRKLAQALDCPAARVARCEDEILRRIGARLKGDAVLHSLLRIGRRSKEGMDHRLNDEELASIFTKA